MTLNELLTKQNFLSKIQLKNGDSELSKSLKVKVMSNRIEYAKVRKQFDEDTQEFIRNLTDEHFRELQNKPDKTEEEVAELTKLTNEANESYTEYVTNKGLEEVSCKEKPITEEEIKNFEEMNKKINDEYQTYIIKRGQEEVSIDTKLTGDEYNELIEVNADNDVEINGNKLSAADFLEIFYTLFIENDNKE